MVKDLQINDLDGQVIHLDSVATRIAKEIENEQDKIDKSKPIVGLPIVSV